MADTSDTPDTRATATATAARADELAARLRRVLPADAVVASGAGCARYAIGDTSPLVVAAPADVEGVRAALAVASEVGAAVVPWGGGTRQALGYAPRRYDLALSLARLNTVIEHDPASLTATVQTGITHATLARRLAESGQMLPLDVPCPRRATLGGTLACDMPGLRRSCFGGPRDLTLGLRALDAAGNEVDTGADEAGPLQIGALGTLGVIVEARLRLVPLPETETTLLGIFGSTDAALEALPALESLVPCPTALAIVRAGGLSPLAHLAPTHGGRALLAARIAGASASIARAGQQGRAILRRAGARTILSIEPELQDAFWGPVHDFTQTAVRQPDEALLRVEGPPAEVPTVMRHAADLARAHGLSTAELADALDGAVWLRVRPVSGAEVTLDRDALARALPAFCASLRARWPRTVIRDCPAALKPELSVWGAPPTETMAALVAARQRLDPAGLLNPGRYPVEPVVSE